MGRHYVCDSSRNKREQSMCGEQRQDCGLRNGWRWLITGVILYEWGESGKEATFCSLWSKIEAESMCCFKSSLNNAFTCLHWNILKYYLNILFNWKCCTFEKTGTDFKFWSTWKIFQTKINSTWYEHNWYNALNLSGQLISELIDTLK